MPRKLSVVTDATPVERKVPASIKEAVDCSERDLLVAMRKRVATEIDSGPPPAYLAPLVRQLRELDKEIRVLDAQEEEAVAKSGGRPDVKFDASAI